MMTDAQIAAIMGWPEEHLNRDHADAPLSLLARVLALVAAAEAGGRERCAKLAAWLQWCLDNCDDSPEYNFGTKATEHMRAILAGKEAPMPPDAAAIRGN